MIYLTRVRGSHAVSSKAGSLFTSGTPRRRIYMQFTSGITPRGAWQEAPDYLYGTAIFFAVGGGDYNVRVDQGKVNSGITSQRRHITGVAFWRRVA